jgi:hypothetical protein
MTDTFIKDPNAVLDYEWDWTNWLTNGDTILSATITPDTGITLDSTTVNALTVVGWFSGGTEGVGYAAVCHITTVQGRVDDRTIYLACRSE